MECDYDVKLYKYLHSPLPTQQKNL